MPKSNGAAGEEMALYAFRKLRWTMFKVPPDVKVCGTTRKPGVFKAVFQDGGMPDYVGYAPMDGIFPHFIACEVKECNTDTMPASRLSRKQIDFLNPIPADSSYVGILWRDGTFEVFHFIDRGSYKKGEGLR
jgi:penicillin-binding protein-related factor A (putative recombinase)